MTCKKCGSFMEDDDLFCAACGTKREIQPEKQNNGGWRASAPVTHSEQFKSGATAKKETNNTKTIIMVIVIVAVVIIASVIVAFVILVNYTIKCNT